MENNQEITNQTQGSQKPLPNSSTVLVLGIVSIVLCWCHGIIGLILAIIALVLANKDMALYDQNPELYTQSSYNNLKSGRTIAIIGLVLAGIFLFMMIIGLLFWGLNFAMYPWDMIEYYN
jgi:small-conductance mechanosensitive channel